MQVEHHNLNYGDHVALRSFSNDMYVAVNMAEQIATATGHHPILYNDAEMVKPEELILVKYDDRETTEPA